MRLLGDREENKEMTKNEIFVGRKEELEEFSRVLEDPRGQAIIVVGNRGMGKTWLVNRMAKMASEHPTIKCGCVRYEVTPHINPNSMMETMMGNAFEAGQVKEGSFDGTKRGLEQWRSFWNVFNIGDLIMSLRRESAKDTRQQFLEQLEFISKRMPENGRAIFIIDPEKEMAEKSDQDWAIVVKNLPEKIKFVFAQRTEDALVDSEVIDGLDNVVRIPDKMLDTLSEEDVDELVNCRRENLRVEITDLRKVLSRYKGHPYAIGAALDLVEAGTELEELPKTGKQTEFAAKQWEKIGEKGDEAIKLFEAYAVLEVAAPDGVVESVSGINSTTRKRLQNDKYLRGLLRDEAGGRRIYHSILADYVLGQMNEEEKKEYHKRAVEVYRGKLKKAEETKTKPDELAAVRLPEHVLVAEREKAFVTSFVNESGKALLTLGLWNNFVSLSERALRVVKKDSEEHAAILGNLGLIYQTREEDKAEQTFIEVLDIGKKLGRKDIIAQASGNLGVIYQTRGELDKAAKMHKEALKISEKLDLKEVMANAYDNLGIVYQKRGKLDKAEKMHKKSLDINKKLGRIDSIAGNCGNLGLIYRKKGKFDKAEEMHKRSLEIEERIGRLEGMANEHSNLGVVYKQRGDLKKAKEYWEKARDLFKKIGMPNEVKKVEGWISNL
jgi:tetratricopeptide (TPR) repeat protein